MRQTTVRQRLTSGLAHLLGAVVAISLAGGCSSGDITVAGVGTGGTGSTTSISGKVADGYLVGATVFLDRNGNYQLDAGEPSATSDATGAYRLTLDAADVGAYPIVALVIQGVTVDTDTHLPVANTYLLSMPRQGVSSVADNFISPLSSQVREMMETGLYATVPEAREALRVKMGLPGGADPLADYLGTASATMHDGARTMASLMGNQMALLATTSGSATTLDVNRYRAMMGLIFANMTAVMSGTPAEMTTLNAMMTTTLSGMSPMGSGQMFQNMSTAFRGGMGGMR